MYDTTISENIRYGRWSSKSNSNKNRSSYFPSDPIHLSLFVCLPVGSLDTKSIELDPLVLCVGGRGVTF